MSCEGIPNATIVAPYIGAWIEILVLQLVLNLSLVAPYIGAWIEMILIPP